MPLATEHETKAEPSRDAAREHSKGMEVETSRVEWSEVEDCHNAFAINGRPGRPGRPLKDHDDDEVKDLRSEIAHFGPEPGLGQFFVCYLG